MKGVTGMDVDVANLSAVAHRWRYAAVEQALGEPFAVDWDRQLVACGDWCEHGRVEAAFLSGEAAAQAMAHHGA